MSLAGRKKVQNFLNKRRFQNRMRRNNFEHRATNYSEPDANGIVSIDFEKHKDKYKKEVQDSISFIGKDLDFFTEIKVSYLLSLPENYLGNPATLKILDVGCGIGITDRFLVNSFRKVYGVEVAK